MTRSIKPVSASVGGVEIVVTADARRRVRRAARACAVIAGYAAGIAGVACAAVAIVSSVLVWPVVACGAVAAGVLWRCRR